MQLLRMLNVVRIDFYSLFIAYLLCIYKSVCFILLLRKAYCTFFFLFIKNDLYHQCMLIIPGTRVLDIVGVIQSHCQ